MLFKIVVVSHGHFHCYIAWFIMSLYKQRGGNERCAVAVFVQHFYKLHNAAFAVKHFEVRFAIIIQFTKICHVDGYAAVEIRQFAEAAFQYFAFINHFLKNSTIGPKPDGGTS